MTWTEQSPTPKEGNRYSIRAYNRTFLVSSLA
jgi:hypothetical protein